MRILVNTPDHPCEVGNKLAMWRAPYAGKIIRGQLWPNQPPNSNWQTVCEIIIAGAVYDCQSNKDDLAIPFDVGQLVRFWPYRMLTIEADL